MFQNYRRHKDRQTKYCIGNRKRNITLDKNEGTQAMLLKITFDIKSDKKIKQRCSI